VPLLLLAFIFNKKKKFGKWSKIAFIAFPKNYALKISKRAKIDSTLRDESFGVLKPIFLF
jgi:hypothetical protein